MAIVTENGQAYPGRSTTTPLLGHKKEALERLASIDLAELCNEAKIERCRATRDLRSCGRLVQHLLTSCGHASLCAECSQRCDSCPICRVSMPQNVSRIRLRLYYECMEAGLISKTHDDRFREIYGEYQSAADVQRLYRLFDVAMENNLVSLICHYITDVCMDENAVSSDPVMSFLLDEVVIKDWCKQAFGNIQAGLCQIYALTLEEMASAMPSLLRYSSHLTSISTVLEVLESSIKATFAAERDLHGLQENVLKAKQHLEIMSWCIRYQFLENVRSRYPDYESWNSLFRERKSAAIKRSWPDLITNNSTNYAEQNVGTLFIEDALQNLEIEQEYGQETELSSMMKDGSTLSYIKSKMKRFAGCYPFENLRSATDVLFLCGSSDMVVAKQAIFMYYLFDRHWTTPDTEWRYIINDFAAAFNIGRHSLLESLVFYLLDDHTDLALQEACSLLPEIAGPVTHPKISQVLLERQNPEAALMVLRWSGLDGVCAYANSEHGGTQLVSLREAVTAVRARVECGLLTEAFMYQRTHHTRAREEKPKRGSVQLLPNVLKGETWVARMEALVTEICCLCIRRNLVDRMIELPWNSDEEKYIHKRLLDYATEDPSAPFGSLLVVYYLQRFRYMEAYQVDRKLQSLEKDCISKSSASEIFVSRIRASSQWRVSLVDKCIQLLPATQQQLLKSGNFDIGIPPGAEVESVSDSSLVEAQVPSPSSSLPPLLRSSHQIKTTLQSKKSPDFGTPHGLRGHMNNSYLERSRYSPIPHREFFTPVKGTPASQKDHVVLEQHGASENSMVDGFPTPRVQVFSPQSSKPAKELNRSSLRETHSNNHRYSIVDEVFPRRDSNLFPGRAENMHIQYPGKILDDQMTTPHTDPRLSTNSIRDANPFFPSKGISEDRPWTEIPVNDSMDYSWSNGNRGSAVVDMTMNGGLRWRSDETSEDEEEPSPEKIIGGAYSVTPVVRSRRRRLSRR